MTGRALSLVALLGAAACGASGGASDAGACTFPAQPFLTLPSDSGRLTVALRGCPQPPTQGVNTIEYTITADGGIPQDGLTLSVLLWMPAMAHGGNAPPVTPLGDGGYRLDDVYLYMAGSWQLQTKISGPETDSVTPTIQVP